MINLSNVKIVLLHVQLVMVMESVPIVSQALNMSKARQLDHVLLQQLRVLPTRFKMQNFEFAETAHKVVPHVMELQQIALHVLKDTVYIMEHAD